MTARDFCFWLQGHFELNGDKAITAEQSTVIRKHLSLVFTHEIDPSMGGPEKQEKLNEAHGTIPNAPTMRC